MLKRRGVRINGWGEGSKIEHLIARVRGGYVKIEYKEAEVF